MYLRTRHLLDVHQRTTDVVLTFSMKRPTVLQTVSQPQFHNTEVMHWHHGPGSLFLVPLSNAVCNPELLKSAQSRDPTLWTTSPSPHWNPAACWDLCQSNIRMGNSFTWPNLCLQPVKECVVCLYPQLMLWAWIFYNSAITNCVLSSWQKRHLTKTVPVQSHNSFLDQRPRKVIV